MLGALGLFTDFEGQHLQTKEEEEENKLKVRRKFYFLYLACLFTWLYIEEFK